ncbi:MAG: hypothetical protein RMZ69_29805 [Nostoc sp. ChiQUE01a]|nr:hypothetical protein [Nostoc sp. ChiQUE01a]
MYQVKVRSLPEVIFMVRGRSDRSTVTVNDLKFYYTTSELSEAAPAFN